MNNNLLNPDALASMARIHFESGRTDHRKWGHLYPEIQDTLIAEMRPYAEAVLAVAQPVVNSVEDVPASLQCIAWEEEPEHGLWKITEDETFVGLIIKSGRSWSPADKYTLRIERPEVPGA